MEATGITIGGAPVSVGDRVVYPNGGICKVKGVESKQIAGQSWKMLMLAREEDGATVMVPEAKVETIGLRKVATADAIAILFQFLAHSSSDPELDWKVRHRENFGLMSAGGLLDTAQVLKGLHALAQLRPLPQKEREMYDSARHQLVGEISAALNLPPAVAENNIDYALTPPPGSGRTAPKDIPLDIKSWRRAMGGKRAGGVGDMDEEEEGDDLGLEGEEEDRSEEEGEAPAAEAGEEEEKKPAAKPAAKPKAPKKPKAAAAPPAIPEAPKVVAPPAPPAAAPEPPKVVAPPPPPPEPPKVVAPPPPPPEPPKVVVAPTPVAPPEIKPQPPPPVTAKAETTPAPAKVETPATSEKAVAKAAVAAKPAKPVTAKAPAAKAKPAAKPKAPAVKAKPAPKAAPVKKVKTAPKAKPAAKKGGRK